MKNGISNTVNSGAAQLSPEGSFNQYLLLILALSSFKNTKLLHSLRLTAYKTTEDEVILWSASGKTFLLIWRRPWNVHINSGLRIHGFALRDRWPTKTAKWLLKSSQWWTSRTPLSVGPRSCRPSAMIGKQTAPFPNAPWRRTRQFNYCRSQQVRSHLILLSVIIEQWQEINKPWKVCLQCYASLEDNKSRRSPPHYRLALLTAVYSADRATAFYRHDLQLMSCKKLQT